MTFILSLDDSVHLSATQSHENSALFWMGGQGDFSLIMSKQLTPLKYISILSQIDY